MFEIRRGNDGSVVVSGRFTAAEADQALAFLGAVTEDVTVDFAELDYISSAGLGVLIATHRRLTAVGCKLRVRSLNRNVRELFRISGFDRIFDVLPAPGEQGASPGDG